LFGDLKLKNSGGLFGAPKKKNLAGGLFGSNAQTSSGELIRMNTQTSRGILSGKSINESQTPNVGLARNPFTNINLKNKNIFGVFQNNKEVISEENNSLKVPRNNKKKLIQKDRKNCIHGNDFTSYNIEKNDNKSGLL